MNNFECTRQYSKYAESYESIEIMFERNVAKNYVKKC